MRSRSSWYARSAKRRLDGASSASGLERFGGHRGSAPILGRRGGGSLAQPAPALIYQMRWPRRRPCWRAGSASRRCATRASARATSSATRRSSRRAASPTSAAAPCCSRRRTCSGPARSSCAARWPRSTGSTAPAPASSRGQRRQPRAVARLRRARPRARLRGLHARRGVALQGGGGARLRRHGAARRRRRSTTASRARASARAETGAVFVHPFDDAGDRRRPGHARARAARGRRTTWRPIIVPVGGGGLIGGVAGVVKAARPDVRVVGVQVEACSAYPASLERGEPVEVARRRRRSPTASRSSGRAG